LTRIMRHKSIVVIALVIVAIVAVPSIYYWMRTRTAVPLAEDLVVEDIRINRRTATLVGVNVTNTGIKPLHIVRVDLIKIQTGMIIASETLSPAVIVTPGSHTEIPLSFALDPEGADYKIMLVTEAGSAASYTFGYP